MKTLNGIVVSTKMQNTAVVEVTRRVAHPLYKKLMKRSKRYKADIAEFTPEVGDMVTISEIKPISKDKYFKLVSIAQKEKKK